MARQQPLEIYVPFLSELRSGTTSVGVPIVADEVRIDFYGTPDFQGRLDVEISGEVDLHPYRVDIRRDDGKKIQIRSTNPSSFLALRQPVDAVVLHSAGENLWLVDETAEVAEEWVFIKFSRLTGYYALKNQSR